MKIFFTAAISQKPIFGKYYKRIYELCVREGFDVESGNLFDMTEGTIAEENEDQRLEWYKKSTENILASDLVVVEISFPSTVNVGHELSVALEKNKPVIALYREDRDPIFLRGKEEDKLLIISYNDKNLEKVLADALDYASDQQDTRFNFFISPQIGAYLDWIAKEKKIPRAVYLRRLIEEDMEKQKNSK